MWICWGIVLNGWCFVGFVWCGGDFERFKWWYVCGELSIRDVLEFEVYMFWCCGVFFFFILLISLFDLSVGFLGIGWILFDWLKVRGSGGEVLGDVDMFLEFKFGGFVWGRNYLLFWGSRVKDFLEVCICGIFFDGLYGVFV